jgi:hypothetical protein
MVIHKTIAVASQINALGGYIFVVVQPNFTLNPDFAVGFG